VLAKAGERLAVSVQASQKFDEGRFNLRKLNDLDLRKQYLIQISNRFATMMNLNVDEDINRTWKRIKEDIKPSAKDSLGLH